MVFDTAVIGGGAAGLYLASRLGGYDVLVLEEQSRVGKKLLATGNGRCNMTFARPIRAGDYNTPAAERVLAEIPPESVIARFCELGLYTRTEEDRVYPYSMTSASVLDALRRGAATAGAHILTATRVVRVVREKDGFVLECDAGGEKRVYSARTVVLATGSDAGSGRDSLSLYTDLGLTRRKFVPSLVPLLTDRESVKGLSGIRVRCEARLGGAVSRGEILFRENGLSGIAALDLSAEYARGRVSEGAKIVLDLVPDRSEEQLAAEMSRAKTAGEALAGRFHTRVAERIAARAGFEPASPADPRLLAHTAKYYELRFEGVRGKDAAQVMSGGLELGCFDSDLMAIAVPGAYAAGEALDVDGICGGFNLQWAWASAEKVARALTARFDAERKG